MDNCSAHSGRMITSLVQSTRFTCWWADSLSGEMGSPHFSDILPARSAGRHSKTVSGPTHLGQHLRLLVPCSCGLLWERRPAGAQLTWELPSRTVVVRKKTGHGMTSLSRIYAGPGRGGGCYANTRQGDRVQEPMLTGLCYVRQKLGRGQQREQPFPPLGSPSSLFPPPTSGVGLQCGQPHFPPPAHLLAQAHEEMLL